MKVGDHRVNHPKLAAGIEKDISIPAIRFDRCRSVGTRAKHRTLQRANRGGANRNDPATSVTTGRDGVATCLINLYVLTVHGVIFNILYPDRLKSARPYMERDFGLGNTGGIELIQQGLIKMQTGGGSSNRTIAAT